jgi:hypothetical protein
VKRKDRRIHIHFRRLTSGLHKFWGHQKVSKLIPTAPAATHRLSPTCSAALLSLSLSRVTAMASRGELQHRRPDLLPPAPSPTAVTRSNLML